ncbi:MAG: division/cell wall cluster transcriptional repressor MraZ [Bacilli bacterium]|nr:division/cell wall cluster transcriptional repressor MraZ [Bacilli bacterium]
MFMGEYHHSIDAKGRIIVPSKVRDDLGENFIVTRGLDGCLFLYPKNEWDKIISKYKELPDTKDKRQFMRIFLSGATICEYDKQGRINIPNPLIEFAKLEKDCIIIGVDERLEIWSKERWEGFIANNEENLSDIADNLFTNNYYG